MSRGWMVRATSGSAGAIGVLWLRGDEAALAHMVDGTLFPSPVWGDDTAVQHGPEALAYGRILDHAGALVDEVMVERRGPGRRVVTGHGGPATVAALMAHFRARGAVEASHSMRPAWSEGNDAADDVNKREVAGEATFFLPDPEDADGASGHSADPLSAASIRDAADTLWPRVRTERQAAFLLTARNGLFARVARGEGPRWTGSDGESGFHAEWRAACALFTTRHVALVGAPNAGKSALFNALVGHDRALVHETPGTTLDRVSAEAEAEGFAVVWHDTPGFRCSTDVSALERLAQERASASLDRMDAVLWVVDGSAPPPSTGTLPEAAWRRRVAGVVVTKHDLAPRGGVWPRWDVDAWRKTQGGDDWPVMTVAARPAHEPEGGADPSDDARRVVAREVASRWGPAWDGTPWVFTRAQAEAWAKRQASENAYGFR